MPAQMYTYSYYTYLPHRALIVRKMVCIATLTRLHVYTFKAAAMGRFYVCVCVCFVGTMAESHNAYTRLRSRKVCLY